jgi:A/G-specific adenine glycosylase
MPKISSTRCCRENSVAEAIDGEGVRTRAPFEGDFAERVLSWFDQHGRHDLPWQHPRSAYHVWLAEIMLQQTQVKTVIPYYRRFLQQFPTLGDLARADLDDVLALWSGLGYYSRARNLHRTAQICLAQHAGDLPTDFEAISALPGIGRSTAGAILAQAHGLRQPILDGNVRRVLSRYRAVAGDPAATAVQQELWALAAALLPEVRLADYTQALMDLGAILCTRRRPACTRCPLGADCDAFLQGRMDEFPHPRSRRERPLRRSTLLWVHDDQQRLLLRRRPPTGIWAGLWSLVDGDTTEQALAALRQLGVEGAQPCPMASVRHEFTHFSLDIDVQSVRATGVAVADGDSRWCSVAGALQLGLPQPLRRLLEQHPAEPNNNPVLNH